MLKNLNRDREQSHYDERQFWWNEITQQDNPELAKAILAIEKEKRMQSLEGHNGSIKCLCASTRKAEVYSGSFDSCIYAWDIQAGLIKKKLLGQKGSINSLAFSHKLNFLASCSADGSVFLWDLEDYTCLQTFNLGTGAALSVLFSPAEDKLLCCGEESICVWSMETNELSLRLLNEKLSHIFCLAMLSNSPVLLSGHEKSFIRMWEVSQQGRLLETLFGHSATVTAMALTSTNSHLFSGSLDKSIRIWQLSDRVCIRTIQNAQFSINCLAVSSQNEFLYAAGGDGVVWKYSLNEHFQVVATMQGHSNEVAAVALASGDKMLYSGGLDMSIKGWNCESGNLVHNFEGHTEGITVLSLDKTETVLASGSKDNTIKIWNLGIMRCEATLAGHQGKISDLAFTKTNDALFSASFDGTIKIWSLKNNDFRCVQTIHEHRGPATGVVLAGKGKLLCTASYDKSIKVWETSTLQLLGSLEEHEKEITCLALSANEVHLFSGSMDGSIKIWFIKGMSCIDTLYGHFGSINKLVTANGSLNLYSCSKDKTIKAWSSDERICKKTFKGHKDDVLDISVSKQNHLLYSASMDCTVKVWDLESGECINTFTSHTEGVTSIFAFKRFERLITGSLDRSMKTWQLSIPQLDPQLAGHTKPVTKIIVFARGKYLVSVSLDETIRFWDTETHLCLKVIKTESSITTCCMNKEETLLLTGGHDNLIKVWKMEDLSMVAKIENVGENLSSIQHSTPNEFVFSASGNRQSPIIKLFHSRSGGSIRDLVGHKTGVTCMLIASDDSILVTGSYDRDVRIWDLHQMDCASVLKGHSEAVICLYVDPRGMYLYSGSSDKSVKIWSLRDRILMVTLNGHEADVNSITTSSNGNLIFTASSDKTLRVWSTVSFKLLATMERHSAAIRTIDMGPESKFIYSAGDDCTIQIWNFNTMLNCNQLDLYTLEALQGFLVAETYQEKEFSLKNLSSCMKHSEDKYYMSRVNPTMFLSTLRFTRVLEMTLQEFGYPSLIIDEDDDLLFRVLKDDDKRANHLDTLCEFLSNNSDEVYLYNRIIDLLISSSNMKVQKLLLTLFEHNVEPQQGAYLRTKGKLKMDPICTQVDNTKIVSEYEQSICLKESRTLNSIEYIITKFPIDIRNGSNCSRDFFRGLDGCINEVIMGDYQYLINYKWKLLRPFILTHALGFWVLVLAMSYHLVFAQDSVLLLLLCVLMNLIYVVYEVICAWGEFFDHIFRDMNWLDLACYAVNIFSLILIWSRTSQKFRYIIFVFDIFFYFLRGITYLRIFKQTRYLISMILKVFFDMLSFLIILFLCMAAISMVSMNLKLLRDEEADFETSFIDVYLLALGEFRTLETTDTLIEWIQFIVTTIVMTLVLLNLLIAIISNTYEEVKGQRAFFDLKEKLGIISDFENFLCKLLRRVATTNDYKYQLICHYQDKDSSEELIQQLTSKVGSLEKNIMGRMQALEEKTDMTYQLLRVNRKNE